MHCIHHHGRTTGLNAKTTDQMP